MGLKPVLILVTAVLLLLSASCAPVSQLQSGKYNLSLIRGSESEQLSAKTVEITVEDNQITLKNPESRSVLKGKLEGDRFVVSNQDNDRIVEFNGVLGADKRITGKAVHKKDGKPLFEADFELVPAQ